MKGEMKRMEDLKGAFFKETKITINKIMPSLKLFVSEFKASPRATLDFWNKKS